MVVDEGSYHEPSRDQARHRNGVAHAGARRGANLTGHGEGKSAREDLDSTVTYAEIAKFNLMRSRG